MTFRLQSLVVLVASLGLGACSLFGDKDELKPAELVKLTPTLKVRRAWSANLGGDADFLRLALRPAGDGNRVYAASADGKVSAFDPETGDRVWRVDLDAPLTAGPGVGSERVVVVTSDGLVVTLDAANGDEQWRAEIKGESVATPLIADDAVIVQTVDNRLRALDLYDHRELWTVNQSMPSLTQRGNASPIRVGTNVVAGFDNGHVLAVDLATGVTTWDALLAPPTGRSDLERLSDVDGNLAAVGQDIYAAGYQGRIASIAAESGQIMWGLDVSSYDGVSADWSSVYTVQDVGTLIAVSRRTGAENWRQDILLRREPTVPVPFLTTVVTGDFEGYLHFFSSVDGDYEARVKTGGGAISTPPIVIGERLYVQTDGGKLLTYRIDEPEPSASPPDAATDEGA